MSGPPRIRSSSVTPVKEQETESRQILGPTGNKARVMITTTIDAQKSALKQQAVRAKVEKHAETTAEGNEEESSPECVSVVVPSKLSLRRKGSMKNVLLRSNSMSLNASCSSDASSDASSPQSRASTGRMNGKSVVLSSGMRRKQQCVSKLEKVVFNGVQDNVELESSVDVASQAKKRCAWVTHNTDLCYTAFHDEEWGVPVHDDRKLFELLSLSGALAELTWPVILNKRHLLREVFLDFDPFSVSKLNEKKIVGPGNSACSFLSEAKLRAIIENARQMCKIIEEFGSFDEYIWNYVNHKPIVSRFRYPRQVPIRTSKADMISKDLVKRGFRSVGPTTIYAFMQVSGLTNDHLISCFRFNDCIDEDKDDYTKMKSEKKLTDDMVDLKAQVTTEFDALARAVDDLSLSRQ